MIVSDTSTGKRNADLELASGMILEGGSWKRQRIVVVLPTAEMINARVALSHWNLIFPVNQPVFRLLALGQEVGEAYSNAIESIQAHPEISTWEYLLTIESDNMPPPDGVLKLLRRMEAHPEYACIGGLYWTKYESGVPQIWGDVSDPAPNFRPQVPRAGELVECRATGMGFNLWRMSLFRDPKLKRPWFRTVCGPEGTGTQDLAFWSDARKYGHRCAVDCDCLVGHWDEKGQVAW